ncbi:hypothetical protein MANES_02G106700v8 [Manihot esculenta]|uniref:Uncharacterized protein n=1 Tax=Manihot esculenta TaxID=3983 RepID=A0ACB7I506_MANES|nr:hypothetical protein MANES_02G106700v8 [Manihot esculenta]
MREALFRCVLLFLCSVIQLTSATVVLKPFLFSFPDLPAKFAVRVNRSGICGALHVANPLDACSSLLNRFGFNETEQVRIALIIRGECPFENKIRNAQNAGFHAAIVYDDRDKRNLVYMMMNPDGIKVHAVFVSKPAGEILKEHARGEESECCIYLSHSHTAWTVLAISLLSLLVILTFLIIAFVVPRHWIHWQRTHFRSKSVDVRVLEGLPCFTFYSTHLNCNQNRETCAICLEDYKDGEILKVLPCQHEFHSSCVDSWLTKWGTFCPVCKFDMKTKFVYSEVSTQNLLPIWDGLLNCIFSVSISCAIIVFLLCSVGLCHMGLSLGLISCGLFLLLLINYSSEAEVVTVDVKAAKGFLESGYIYLDVRTAVEFKKGHVHAEKVFNIPFMFKSPEGWVKNPKFLKEISAVCKEDDHLVVGCQSGGRSLHATADLLAAGFKDVSNMGGGYLAWMQNEFPLKVEEEEERTEL